MASYNKVILMGHLTRDPRLGTLAESGTAVCDLALAVNRRWKGRDGQLREETLFIDCTAFGRQAAAIGENLSKGRPLHVEGRLKLDKWEQEDGQKRSKVRVVVEQFRFVGPKPGGSPEKADAAMPAPKPKARAKPARPSQAPVPAGAGDKQDISF